MPFNSTGTFSLTPTSVAPAVSGTAISSTAFNNTMNDIVSGLNLALCRDGQATPSANLPMATYKHTGVGNASARTEYAAAGQVQDSSLVFDATETGTGDAYEIVLSPAITTYAAGQRFGFIASEANTGASTLNVNSVGAVAIKKLNGADTVTGDILANQVVEVVYNGTNFILLSPSEPTAGTVVAGKVVTADSNLDTTGFRNVTATGIVASPTVNASTSLQIGGVAVTATATELNYCDKAAALGTCEASKVVTTDGSNVITAATITTLTSTTSNITTANITTANITTLNSRDATSRRVLISTGDLSSTPTAIEFTLGSTYTMYEVVLSNITPNTDNVDILIRYSFDGGVTFVSTGTYNYTRNGTPATSASAITIADNVSNDTTEGGISGIFRIHNPNTTRYKLTEGLVFNVDYNTPNEYTHSIFAGINTSGTGSVDAIQIRVSIGVLKNVGNIKLYGIT